jgi:hypothetical protein
LGFDASFSTKQSNVTNESTSPEPAEWIMQARVRRTPGLLLGECGYDATSCARYADKVGVKVEDRKRKIQAEDGKYLSVGIVDGKVDTTPIIEVNSRIGKHQRFELSALFGSNDEKVASGDSVNKCNAH